jgi:hypothetical protein
MSDVITFFCLACNSVAAVMLRNIGMCFINQHMWSSGYDSRLGLSKDIKCERSQVRVLASAVSFAFFVIVLAVVTDMLWLAKESSS